MLAPHSPTAFLTDQRRTPSTRAASRCRTAPHFPDGGHVNIKTSAGDKGLHFESLNWPADHPKKKYIGESFLPWSAFGLEGSFCVTWVQVSMYNEHFGEGGQQAVCVGQPEEPPVTGNKVWVCKYVGTPGVNERLKAGKQPIDVSVNSIKNWDGKTFPGWFADAQGRSVAIAFSDIGGPVPTAADCPTGDEPPQPECVTVVWEMPRWAGSRTPTWPQTFYAAYET